MQIQNPFLKESSLRSVPHVYGLLALVSCAVQRYQISHQVNCQNSRMKKQCKTQMYVRIESESCACIHVCNLCTGNKKANETFEFVMPIYLGENICFAEQEITAVLTNPFHTPLQFSLHSVREPLFLTDCECCTVLLPPLRPVYGSCPSPALYLPSNVCITSILES